MDENEVPGDTSAPAPGLAPQVAPLPLPRPKRRRPAAAVSTVEDDQAASGQTNVDSPQETPTGLDQDQRETLAALDRALALVPPSSRYRVVRAHDGRELGEELELEPTGEVAGQVAHGLLVQLEQ